MKKRFNLGDATVVGNPFAHYIRFTIYLYIFWILISGVFTPKFFIMGAVTSLVVAYVCMPLFMIHNLDRSKQYFMLAIPLYRLIPYAFWTLKELILANIDVAQASLKKTMPIEPQVIQFKVNYENPIALVMLANTITLTPGTITINVTQHNIFTIHALTPGAADGIKSGSMIEKVAWLYGDNAEYEMFEELVPLKTN